MAYQDPNAVHDPTTGTSPPAAWGDVLRDDLEWLARNKPHCRVYNSANISIPDTTATVLTFDTERVDVGGVHSTSSNTGRLTIPSGGDGWYSVGCAIGWGANATGVRGMFIRVNGATNIAHSRIQAPTGGVEIAEQVVTTFYQMAAGDYFDFQAYQTSGGALNVSALANYSPEAWCTWEAV